MLISYARNGEDVVFDRVFGHLRRETYLDLGSGDGRASRWLSEIGWRGVLVGLDDSLGEMPSIDRDRAEMLSGDAPFAAIAEALETVGGVHLGVLRIGASHTDRAAVISAALERCQPRVVVVEQAPTELDGGPFLGAGYLVGGFDGVNTYLARADDGEAIAKLYPACARDDYVRAEAAATAAELSRLQKLLATHERTSEQAAGADRAVLTAPSPQRRRYAARHVMVQTPLITLDRVAVLTPPETSGRVFAELLAAALEADLHPFAHPADIEWNKLPERVVIGMTAPFSELLRVRLISNGFRVVVIARDPLEQELSRQTQASGREPSAEEFMRQAFSEAALSGLELTSRWLVEPGTVRVDFAEMRVDLFAVLIRLFEELGIGVDDVSTLARRLSPLGAGLQERLDGARAEPLELGDGELDAFSSAHRLAFERLGIALDAASPAASADAGDSSVEAGNCVR